jgi:hypothetical protein
MTDVYFGDLSYLPPKYLDHINEVSNKHIETIAMQPGDVLLVDNYRSVLAAAALVVLGRALCVLAWLSLPLSQSLSLSLCMHALCVRARFEMVTQAETGPVTQASQRAATARNRTSDSDRVEANLKWSAVTLTASSTGAWVRQGPAWKGCVRRGAAARGVVVPQGRRDRHRRQGRRRDQCRHQPAHQVKIVDFHLLVNWDQVKLVDFHLLVNWARTFPTRKPAAEAPSQLGELEAETRASERVACDE